MYNYRDTYQNAISKCENEGAVLATPKSAAQNAFLNGIAKNKIDFNRHLEYWLWIEIDDISTPDRLTYKNGAGLLYTNWYVGWNEPSFTSYSEDSVIMDGWSGQWRTMSHASNQLYRFICMRDVTSQAPTVPPTVESTTVDSTSASFSSGYGKIYI